MVSFPSLEPAAQALFKMAESTNSPANPYKVMSRRWRHFKDVSPNDMPALFQYQLPGFTVEKGARSLPVFRFRFYWMVYLPVSAGMNSPTSPVINNYMTALIKALLPTPTMPRNTLGNLVYDCYIDGQGLMDEGLLQTPSLIGLPITILTGA
jgi:hypothetical protein